MSESVEHDGEPADLWSLPHDVRAAPAATDTLLAAWAGALAQGGDDEASPRQEHPPTDLAAGRQGAPGGPPRRQVDATHPGLMVTVLVSAAASAVVGLATLLILGVSKTDTQISEKVKGFTGSTATDERIVIRGPSTGCLTMLVEPQRAGIATDVNGTDVNGTCFRVG